MTLLENHSTFFTVKSISSSELKEQGHRVGSGDHCTPDIGIHQCTSTHGKCGDEECAAGVTLEEQGQALRIETE